jgi:hypothetical protein
MPADTEDVKPGHEYGRYVIGSLRIRKMRYGRWVHTAEDAVIVYFRFER